ncbi:MAG: hypothetical protein ABSC94_14110 [Polyangiaceae bacterium]
MTSLVSAIGRAARSPFESNHADPWGKEFVDLPELNAAVTDAIADAIARVRSTASRRDAELRTTSTLVLGPAGAGKTHLFARLRRKLGPRAVFVHLRPLVGTEMTPRYVLDQIVQQLAYPTETHDYAASLKQFEALVGSSLAHLDGVSPDLPRAFLDELVGLDEAGRSEKLDWAVERLLERHQEADEMYLARLLRTPFMKRADQRAALAWLAGRELEELQLQRLGIATGLPENRVLQALQTLGVFAAPGAPIVLVFDQLENLVDAEASGTRLRAYGNLVSELFDATRGYVLVHLALDSEWEHGIRPQLSQAQRSRLGSNPIAMALPTPAQARALVQRWAVELPDRPEPFPWPFGERRVEAWSRTPGMTPRMLMSECRAAFALGPNTPFAEPPPQTTLSSDGARRTDAPNDDDAALAVAWEGHMAAARHALDEAAADRRSADPARLVGGMASCLRFVNNVETSRVDARQHVQLIARVGSRTSFVAFLHQTHPRSAGTALDRLAESLTSGHAIAVRERVLEFPPTWKKVQASVTGLLARGLRWISLDRDDVARLLALESFIASARSKDLEGDDGRIVPEEAVSDWIHRTLNPPLWPVARAVLGQASEAADGVDADDVGAHPSAPSPGNARVVTVTPSETGVFIQGCLAHLRVVSLDRLVREVARANPSASRADVMGALEAMPDRVRWFGRAIVGASDGDGR